VLIKIAARRLKYGDHEFEHGLRLECSPRPQSCVVLLGLRACTGPTPPTVYITTINSEPEEAKAVNL
jgi:hypothetical protein